MGGASGRALSAPEPEASVERASGVGAGVTHEPIPPGRLLPVALLLFATTRVVMASKLNYASDDSTLYAKYVAAIYQKQLPGLDFSYEYPLWSLVVLVVPAFFSATVDGFIFGFRLEMMVVELVVVCLIYGIARSVLRLRHERIVVALGAYFILSSLGAFYLLDRFDLVVTMFVLAALYFGLRPGGEAPGTFLLAVGASVKLVPLLALPPLVLHHLRAARPRMAPVLRALGWFGFYLVAVNLPFVVFVRLGVLSFWSYHAERGIQIESVPASLLMVLRYLGLPLEVRFDHGCWNVVAPHGAALAAASTVALVVLQALLVLAAALGAWRERHRPADHQPPLLVLRFLLCALLTFLVCGRVLSPQFLLWVSPLAALLAAIGEQPMRSAAPWVAVALLTSMVYPFQYRGLLQLEHAPRLMLLARNALLVAVAVGAWRPLLAYAGLLRDRIDQGAAAAMQADGSHGP